MDCSARDQTHSFSEAVTALGCCAADLGTNESQCLDLSSRQLPSTVWHARGWMLSLHSLACPCLALGDRCAHWCDSCGYPVPEVHSVLVSELVGDISTLLCLSWTGLSKPWSPESPVAHFLDRETEAHSSVTVTSHSGWQVAWAGTCLSLKSLPLAGNSPRPHVPLVTAACSFRATLQGYVHSFGWLCRVGG